MTRYIVVLALVPPLLLAGCLGGPAATDPAESAAVTPDDVPGVTNGRLSNASALVAANRDAVTTAGAIIQVNQSSQEMAIDAQLAVGANFSTYSLSGSGTIGANQTTTIDQWSNRTTQVVRTTAGGETTYRVLDGHDDRLSMLGSVETFLAAGEFVAANGTAGNGTVVLTADTASAATASMASPEHFDGRLVVDASGQIHHLTVTVTRDGETVSYAYELRRVGVERVPKPAWLENVPAGATVQAQLSIAVENDTYLALEHTGGDVVPRGTTVRVASNGTSGTVGLDSSLSAGDTRYLYFDADTGHLRVSASRPAQTSVSPVTSPVSVRIVTDAGAVLHSGSMGWASETASDAEGTGESTVTSDSAGGASSSAGTEA